MHVNHALCPASPTHRVHMPWGPASPHGLDSAIWRVASPAPRVAAVVCRRRKRARRESSQRSDRPVRATAPLLSLAPRGLTCLAGLAVCQVSPSSNGFRLSDLGKRNSHPGTCLDGSSAAAGRLEGTSESGHSRAEPTGRVSHMMQTVRETCFSSRRPGRTERLGRSRGLCRRDQ